MRRCDGSFVNKAREEDHKRRKKEEDEERERKVIKLRGTSWLSSREPSWDDSITCGVIARRPRHANSVREQQNVENLCRQRGAAKKVFITLTKIDFYERTGRSSRRPALTSLIPRQQNVRNKTGESCFVPDNTTDIRHQWVVKPPPPESARCSGAPLSRWRKGLTMLMMLWGFALNY